MRLFWVCSCISEGAATDIFKWADSVILGKIRYESKWQMQEMGVLQNELRLVRIKYYVIWALFLDQAGAQAQSQARVKAPCFEHLWSPDSVSRSSCVL